MPDISFDSFNIILGGLEGDGFSINSSNHTTYGNLGGILLGGNGYIISAISAKGSFTSISFVLNFGGVQSGQIGTMMAPFDWSSATPYSSVFSIYSPDGSSSITVVPEPSTLSLLAFGLGVLFRRSRKRD